MKATAHQAIPADSGTSREHRIEIPANFNWNTDPHPMSPLPETIPGEPTPVQAARTRILSECLRDGLQGIAAFPSIEMMVQYVRLLADFGVRHATVGIYPGNADAISSTIKTLLARMRDEVPSITPSVLSLCSPGSLNWTAECKDIHPGLESIVFMGSAPSRRLAQGWDLNHILRNLETYISKTSQMGIPVIAGTEHTSQTSPDDLRQITRVQVESGAYCVALADTIGVIRPRGTYRIVRFIRDLLDEFGVGGMRLDWHGHRDTGHALNNALMAIAAGASHIHVVSRGVGERSGNTSLEEVVLNLATIAAEAGLPIPWDMSGLLGLITYYQEMVGVITPDHGVLGKRYSHTSSGIHTDAIMKANELANEARQAQDFELERKLHEMARTVYSAIDPATIGGHQSVTVGPWSGRSSVKLAYLLSGRNPQLLTHERIERVLTHAKALGRELESDELEACLADDPTLDTAG